MAGENILIVEDDDILVKFLKRILTGSGYIILAVAAKGEDAIKLARESRPELILMDIELAGKIDGIETAKAIRTFSDVPLLFLTGYPLEDNIREVKLTAPAGYLIKPVQTMDLLANIEMVLYRHTLECRLKESEHRYRSLVELSPDSLLISLEGRIVFANQASLHLFGASSVDEMSGKRVSDMFCGQADPNFREELLSREVGELGPFNASKIRRLDGSIANVIAAAAHVETKEGVATQVIVRFISDSKHVDDELREADAFTEPLRAVHSLHIPESIVRSIAFIEKNLNSPMSLEKIAGEAFMSKFHFCRIFKKFIGTTPKQYVINLRLRRAMTLLRQKDLSISVVAMKSGFGDLSEFNKQFKKLYGSSPSSLRDQIEARK